MSIKSNVYTPEQVEEFVRANPFGVKHPDFDKALEIAQRDHDLMRSLRDLAAINGRNPFAKGSLNLTQQLEIMHEDRERAARLKRMAEAEDEYNPFLKATYNLTQQALLRASDPAKAARLDKQAREAEAQAARSIQAAQQELDKARRREAEAVQRAKDAEERARLAVDFAKKADPSAAEDAEALLRAGGSTRYAPPS